MTWTRVGGLLIVFMWFAIGGVAHLTVAEFLVRIVPPYVPFPRAVILLTGLAWLAGAAALWVPRWRPLAGAALFVLTICVTPANVYMLMNPELFPAIPMSALLARLIMQLLLLACIWWATEISTLWSPRIRVPQVSP